MDQTFTYKGKEIPKKDFDILQRTSELIHGQSFHIVSVADGKFKTAHVACEDVFKDPDKAA